MADVELPPLPPRVPVDKHSPTGVAIYGYTHVMVRDYARACVAHATAAKDAEIKALRAERMLVIENQAHWKERAERLAEALRMYEKAGIGNSTDFRLQAEARDAANRALLRDQEEGK